MESVFALGFDLILMILENDIVPNTAPALLAGIETVISVMHR